MNWSTAVIVIIIAVVCAYAVISYRKKLKSGCCGGGDGDEKKIKIADKNKANYSFEGTVSIEGMSCGNCVRHVENALNSLDGVWAKVSLEKKSAEVLLKSGDEERLRKAVTDAGYAVTNISIIKSKR